MSLRYALAPSASRDLAQIFEYVLANDGVDAAIHVVSGLDKSFEKIARLPGIGHRRQDYTAKDLRFYTIWSYYIVYKPDSDPLEIVRIIHSSRDMAAAMDEIA